MNYIQELINETKADILLAEIEKKKCKAKKAIAWYTGYISANKNHIIKLTLLLNAETQTTVKSKPA